MHTSKSTISYVAHDYGFEIVNFKFLKNILFRFETKLTCIKSNQSPDMPVVTFFLNSGVSVVRMTKRQFPESLKI